MKEAFVFSSPCEPLKRPRHHSAHTNINNNILRLFYQDGKHARGLGWKATSEITKSHQFHLAVPSSSVLDIKVKDTVAMLREKKANYEKQLKLLKIIMDKPVIRQFWLQRPTSEG